MATLTGMGSRTSPPLTATRAKSSFGWVTTRGTLLLGGQTPGTGISTGPVYVAVGDMNNDGNMDLVTANSAGNSISVLLGNGNGTFQTAITTGLVGGIQPMGLALGDFNNDSKLDVATADYGSNDVAILLGNGNGTFQTPTLEALAPGLSVQPLAIASADVNKDGILDLVTANSGTNDVSVLLGNGDGTFSVYASYGTGSGATSPSNVALGDVNHDGNVDIVVANYGSGTAGLAVLLGNGDGTFRVRRPWARQLPL